MFRSTPMKMIVSFVCCLGASVGALGCGDKVAEPPAPERSSAKPAEPDPTELKIEDLTPGAGERAVKDGDGLKVHYVGKLFKNGAKFDSNEKGKGKPFEFKVGEGVIEGWSKGVVGMKKGGKRKLTIPAKMAYGSQAQPKIPADSALVFEIELVGFQDEPESSVSPSASAAPSAGASASAGPSAGPSASGAPKAGAAGSAKVPQ